MRYYVRLFCNGIKVRSTGGDHKDIFRTLESFDFNNHKEHPIQWYELIKEHIPKTEEEKFLKIPLYELKFEYQIVKKRHKHKKVILKGKILDLKNISLLEKFKKYLPLSNSEQLQDVLMEYNNSKDTDTFEDIIKAKQIRCNFYTIFMINCSNIDDESFRESCVDYFYKKLEEKRNGRQ